MNRQHYIGIFIIALVLLLLVISNRAEPSETERFGDWYCIYENGQKKIATFSYSENTVLTVYVDKQLITRLNFEPHRKIYHATFDGKRFRMNYKSLYGYDHWIRKMIKYRKLRIQFSDSLEVFSLKGFSKAIRWLHK